MNKRKIISVIKTEIIKGLDPAGPGFESTPGLGISSSDAKFVEIIHTDAGNYGLKRSAGHVDFYPNGGGQKQPGCSDADEPDCSHDRAYIYYAESLRRPKEWLAVHCSDYFTFLKGDCVTGDIAPFPRWSGNFKKKNGSYFLITGNAEPFGLGMKGVEK